MTKEIKDKQPNVKSSGYTTPGGPGSGPQFGQGKSLERGGPTVEQLESVNLKKAKNKGAAGGRGCC